MKLPKLETALKLHGFEIIREESKILIETIKIALFKKLNSDNIDTFSSFLSKRFNRFYSGLSKVYSKSKGSTIEKYEILPKVKKVKELI